MPLRRKKRKSILPAPRRIWAPWRLQYILDPNVGPLLPKGRRKRGCVFCNRRHPRQGNQGDRRELILFRGRTCYIILNKFPYNNGHLMVIPYAHVRDFSALKPKEAQEMMLLAQRAVKVLESRLHANGMNIGMNLKKSAGAGIPDHIHLHIVPRWEADNNFMPVIGDTRVLPAYNEKIYDYLIGGFRS